MATRFSKSLDFDASIGLFVLHKMPPTHQWIVDLLAVSFGHEAVRIPLAEDLGRRQAIGVVTESFGALLLIQNDTEGFDINHNPQLVLDWIKEVQDVSA